jgi:hypothetical protein
MCVLHVPVSSSFPSLGCAKESIQLRGPLQQFVMDYLCMDLNTWNSVGVNPFTGALSGLNIQEAPHMKKDPSPFSIFLLFFLDMILLLVVETNKHYSIL